MKYLIKTYGCQMNINDSEKMAGILEEPRMKMKPIFLLLIHVLSEKKQKKNFFHI